MQKSDYPFITVVVPVFNMGKYLPRALECLVRQEYPNFEIVIVDDGSNDGSGKVCDQLADFYSELNIRVVHKENGGLSSARNKGIECAHGEYIIFPDPDDWTETNYLSLLMELHLKYQGDLEICGFYINTDNSETVKDKESVFCILERETALDMLMKPNFFIGSACNKLYHMSVIRQHDLWFDTELGMAQDLHFAYRYFCLCDKIVYDPTPLYHYYQGSGGVTTIQKLTPRKLSGLKAYEKIAELAHGTYPAVEKQAYSTIFNLSCHFLYLYYASKMKDKELLERLKNNLCHYSYFFFSNALYSPKSRFLAEIALLNPKAFFIIKRIISLFRGNKK